jgi:hypothetical protein
MTTPQPCGAAASALGSAARLSGPMTLFEIRPEVLKNAIPASAVMSGEVIVTPEMSRKFSVTSLEPPAWRLTCTTAPPPSRRNGAVPANDGAALVAGWIVTLLAPAPRIVSGFVISSAAFEPACAGLLVAFGVLMTSP